MNFYNENEKRDEGGPVVGKVGASFKKTSAFGRPAFSKAAGSIMDRIKNLSKKDLAFVAVGLSVLVTAPVAEYMMSKPTGADQLTPGFGSRADASGSPYEPGINALSQGSPDGTGEVVTPLSSRDPASLILGSEPAQAPAAPQQPAPRTDFRDSMKDSARNAFSEASKSAGVPTVIPKMQSSLRGMGSFFSGGEGTRTTGGLDGKILSSAQNASGKSATRSMVGPVGGAGYKGVSSSPNSASKGAFDKLRSQADKAAGNFNDGASSIRSLDKAAADSLDLAKGGSGGMSATDGDKYSRPSGSSLSDRKNLGGETLEQAAAKARQAKALEWEFFKKYEIPKQIIQAMLTGFTGSLTKWIGGITDDLTGQTPGPGPAPLFCFAPSDGKDCKNGEVAKYPMSICNKDKGVSCNPSDCPCGVHAKGAPGTGGSTPGGDTPGGNNPGGNNPGGNNPGGTVPSGSAVPASYTEMLKTYDQTLTELVDNAREGQKTADPKMLLKFTKATVDSVTKCSGLAKTLFADIGSKTPKLANAEATPYKTAVLAAESRISVATSKYEAFIGKVDAQIAKLEGGGTAMKEGKEVLETGAGVAPLKALKAIKAEAENYKENSITLANKKLNFHKKAMAFYDKQSELVVDESGGMTSEVGNTYNTVNDLVKGLKDKDGKDITDETAGLPDNVTVLKDAFKKLTGLDSSIPAAPAPVQVNPNPSPSEPPAKEESDPYMAAPVEWRGADYGKLWNEKKVDDTAVKTAEADYWAGSSPLKKLKAREIDGDLVPANDISGDMVALSIRGVSALPYDIKGANGYTAEITTGGMDLLEKSITEWTAQCAAAGAPLDDTTPTVTPGATDTMSTADKDSVMRSAGDIPANQTAAEKTMASINANKSTNSTFTTARNNAQAQFAIMQNRQTAIAALKSDIESSPAKATPANYSKLRSLVAEYNLAKKGDGTPQNKGFDAYADQANLAGKPYVKPVKPNTTPTTIINVQGGNANATATADSHSGSVSGVQNRPANNVVVQPAVKLQAPGSFNIAGVNFVPRSGVDGEVVAYTSRVVNISSLASPYYTINCVRAGKWFNTSGCQKHGAVYGSEACPSLDSKACGPAPSK